MQPTNGVLAAIPVTIELLAIGVMSGAGAHVLAVIERGDMPAERAYAILSLGMQQLGQEIDAARQAGQAAAQIAAQETSGAEAASIAGDDGAEVVDNGDGTTQ